MAIPVITAPASPRIIAQGVAFSQALTASNTPTSWAATGLPSGLAINTTTGTISGTPLTEGVAMASITATNGSGTSAAATISFVIVATPPGNGGAFDLELDYELMTNEVRIPGIDPPKTGEPLFYAPKGTNRYLLVGILKRGVLHDINPDSEDVAIKIGMKELEPERLLEVTTGATVKVAAMTADRQRYRIPFRVTPGNWTGPLGDYEADEGTIISALAELQVSVGEVAVLHDDTLTDSAIAIEGGITSPITGDHDFTGIDEFSVATPMRLTLTLAVSGRVLQTVELVREFNLIFTGGAFVLSNLSGPTTGQGAVEASQWRATLNLTSLTGDANSVDCDYSITTTDDLTVEDDYVVLPGFTVDEGTGIVTPSSTYVLELWSDDSEDPGDLIGTFTPASDYASVAAAQAAFLAGWETASGANDVISVTLAAGNMTIKIEESSAVLFISWSALGTTYSPVIQANVEGTSTTCSVTARLEQLEAPESVPLNLTSNSFRIGVARDMVPD
jgi:hypothetical protein